MKINQTHWNEWTTESAVHPEIVKLNVQSIKNFSPKQIGNLTRISEIWEVQG